MELIKITVFVNKYGGSIETYSDLEDALGSSSYKMESVFLNLDKIRSISSIKTCNMYYKPHTFLGKYFVIECIDGTDYHLPEYEFKKIEKFILNEDN